MEIVRIGDEKCNLGIEGIGMGRYRVYLGNLPPAINRSHRRFGKLPRAMNPLAIRRERNLSWAINPTHKQ